MSTASPDVPVVDLTALRSTDPSRRAAAIDALRDGFGRLGLVTVTGHGLDEAQLARFHQTWTTLTDRAEADKRRWHRPDLWCQRGWTPPHAEVAVASGGRPDFKECWFAAPLPGDDDGRAAFPELYAPNVIPDGGEVFAAVHHELGLRLHAVGAALLSGCEAALGLDDGALTALTDGAAHVTRALRYLPLDAETVGQGVPWGEEHTDFNLLTVLGGGRFLDPQGQTAERPDDTSGLYLRTRPTAAHPDGQLVLGRAPKGHLLAQVGQQLEILTGGRLLATPHVIRAPSVPGWGRTSLAHFVHVHPLRTLAPLGPFATPAAVQTYRPPSLAGTYALKTLVEIGLAPTSTRLTPPSR